MFFLNRFTCSPFQLKQTITKLNKKGLLPIIDYVNEYNYNIEKTKIIISNNIKNFNGNHFAVKLSAINCNHVNENFNTLNDFCLLAKKYNSKILIDAEDYHLQPQINDITDELMKKYNKHDILVYKTYQMYRKDAIETFMYDLTKKRNYNIGFKLVRGAYLNQDKKYGILCDTYQETNENYDHAIKMFCEIYKKNDLLMCASHNEKSISKAIYLSKKFKIEDKIEFAQLMGMSNNLSHKLVKQEFKTYKYLPYGNLTESLPYLMRRLYENYPIIVNIVK
tara:strand:+ start:728 stop:1564 length:837 start_codon:yes stop_codon:yes gene_type:complete